MNKKYLVSMAIAAALGSSGAFALDEAATNGATLKLIVSGASAQRDTFRTELQKLCDGAGTDFDTYVADDSNSGTSEDFRLYSCTLDSNTDNANVPVTIQSQTVAVWYRSEGGSVYGIGPLLTANPAFTSGVKHLVVGIAGQPCTNVGVTGSHNCPITGYNLTTDTDTTAPVSRLQNLPTQLGVSDVEPRQFLGVNWPLSGTSVLGDVPTGSQLTQLTNLNGVSRNTTGTVFGILVSNNGATAGMTSITREAATSIFSGSVLDWSQVSDAAGNPLPAGAIKVCRREPGSGTQVAASIYFMGTGCSTAPLTFLAEPAAVENSTGGQMNACVGGTTQNAIGFASFATSNPTGAHFVSLDGVAPGANAAALGVYPFAYEATSQKRTGLAGTQLVLADTLIAFAQKQTALPAAPASSFALPQFNTPASFAKATNVRPVAVGTRSKVSCKLPLQVN